MGRASDRSTERQHWLQASTQARATDEAGNVSDCQIVGSRETSTDDNGAFASQIDSDSEMETDSTDNNTTPSIPVVNPNVHDTDQYKENPTRKIVVDAVVKALRIMKDSGTSIKTFEDILEFGKGLLFSGISKDHEAERIDSEVLLALWPKNWNIVQKLLQEEGYKEAQEYCICFCREEKETTRNGITTKKFIYSGKYSVLANGDTYNHCGNKGYLKYYYLGLKSKVKNWFRNRNLCSKMLAHWKECSHWLGRNQSYDIKREIWDGERWLQLQWFWDPHCYMGIICPSCGVPVSADHLINSDDSPNGSKQVECPGCFEMFDHFIEIAHGSPLNLALIGHCDGWQPFGTSYRGCGSLEVSIANLTKSDRNHTEEVYVVGFVPSYHVPNLPESLDHFCNHFYSWLLRKLSYRCKSR
jgi:hypothetical protein